jgi:hypothetical protein
MGPTGTAMASQIWFALLHDLLFLSLLFFISCDSSTRLFSDPGGLSQSNRDLLLQVL